MHIIVDAVADLAFNLPRQTVQYSISKGVQDQRVQTSIIILYEVFNTDA